jgi:hypothetical protein
MFASESEAASPWEQTPLEPTPEWVMVMVLAVFVAAPILAYLSSRYVTIPHTQVLPSSSGDRATNASHFRKSIIERWSLCGPFMTDLESGSSCNDLSSHDDRLYHLDKAAPERSYEEVMDDLQHAPAGEHLAWPDSFYEW